jgi:integrase
VRARKRSANIARAKAARRWMRIFTLAIYLCMRSGELRALSWEHVDFEHWILSIEIAEVRRKDQRKTRLKERAPTLGSLRRFAIDPEVRPLLRARWHKAKRANAGNDPTGRVFPTFPPKRISQSVYARTSRVAGCRRPELYANTAHPKQVTFHDLRATGITWTAMRGDDPFQMKDRAGHTSLATTEKRYMRQVKILGEGAGSPFPPIPKVVVGSSV